MAGTTCLLSVLGSYNPPLLFIGQKTAQVTRSTLVFVSLCFVAHSSQVWYRLHAGSYDAILLCGGAVSFTKWLDGRRFLYLALAALSTCIAVLVKPTAIHIGLLFALLAVYRFGLVSLAKDWRIWVTVGLCLTPIALYFWHAHILYVEYGNTFGVLFSGDTKFGNFSYWLSTEFYAGLVELSGGGS